MPGLGVAFFSPLPPRPVFDSLPARKRLGDALVARGLLSAEDLLAALAAQRERGSGKILGEVLVESGFCTEDEVLEGLADELGLPFAHLDGPGCFDEKAVELLPREFIEKYTVLPLFRVRDVLTVAVCEPTDVFLLDRLTETVRRQPGGAGLTVQIAVAAARAIRRTVQTYLPDRNVFVIDELLDDAPEDAVQLVETDLEELGTDLRGAELSPIIKLVNQLFYQAVREGASDLHVEPADGALRVRVRVDGVLAAKPPLPAHVGPAVASRIKIMADLDISERRLPQDGRIQVRTDGRTVDLRVSTLPGAHGEKVVVRVLDGRGVTPDLAKLGFSGEVLTPFEEQLAKPNGIVLVTGPTGSGKSTTLYAALNVLRGVERNVCTVEDPVEYQLDLVNQFQVNEKIGLTFPAVLRSLLRQDPDVLMVGEIRDPETAKVAVQAALTGHLVFSTLHTNGACESVGRLTDMGVPPYLLASSLNAVLAQRLVRRICPHCREAYEPEAALRSAVRRMGADIEEFHRGKGCDRCRRTGFAGRIGIHELLVIDEPLRDLIAAGVTLSRLTRHAAARGVAPLRYDGLRKVREGLTTLEEVLRVSPDGWVPTRETAATRADEPIFAASCRPVPGADLRNRRGGPADPAALVRELTGGPPVASGTFRSEPVLAGF